MAALTLSSYQPISTIGLNQAISATSTTQAYPLGTKVTCRDMSGQSRPDAEFIYLKGVASTAVGSWVTFADDGATALAVADATGQVAIAMSACVANNYGWYQISGVGIGKVATSFADDAKCFLTSTGGTVDDAIVKADRIRGAKSGSGIDDNGLAEIELNYPFVEDEVVAELPTA